MQDVRLTIAYSDGGEGTILAEIAEVPGVVSEGRTRAEARENVLDALRTVLQPDAAPTDFDSVTLTLTS